MGSAHSKNATVDEEGKIALRLVNYAATTASSNGKNVLATVEQATLLTHEPHLQEAATLAVALLDMIPVSRTPTPMGYDSPILMSYRGSVEISPLSDRWPPMPVISCTR